MLDLFMYSAIGYGVGTGVSLLTRNRYVVKNLIAGVGGSYGFVINKDSLNYMIWK